MKILFVTNMYPTSGQPAFGVFIHRIVEALKHAGVEVDVISVNGRGKNALSKMVKYTWFYIRLLRASIVSYDVLHISYPSHSYFPFIYRRIRAYLVVRVHGYDVITRGPLRMWAQFMTTLALKRANMIVSPSKYFLDVLNARYSHSAVTTTYTSGGVNTAKYYPKPRACFVKYTIGYVGWMLSGKGPQVLIRSLEHLPNIQDIEVLMIGDGPQRMEMEELVGKLGLGEIVSFCGQLENDLLVDYYNRMDIFVFPTLEYESFGNVSMEAMACSVPVIGSDRGAIPEYISSDVNGYLFEAGNERMLARCLTRHQNLDAEKTRVMKDNALATAMKYETETHTRAFVRELERELTIYKNVNAGHSNK